MGLFDRFTGKTSARTSHVPSQYDIASMIASTIDGVFTEMGPQKLFQDDFQIIVDNQGQISGYWGDDPSSWPGYKSSVLLADLDELANMKEVLSWDTYKSLPPETAKELAGVIWSTLGYEMVDKLAIAVLNRL